MSKRSFYFFADKDDISLILEVLEVRHHIKYCQAGPSLIQNIPCFNSYLEMDNIGYVPNGDWNFSPVYLIIPQEFPIKYRTIKQYNGEIKHIVEQPENPESILYTCSGIHEEGVLVAGLFTSVYSNAFCNELVKDLYRLLKKHFVKIGSFYVGPNAEAKLEAGWRLVTSASSPKEYDLKR